MGLAGVLAVTVLPVGLVLLATVLMQGRWLACFMACFKRYHYDARYAVAGAAGGARVDPARFVVCP
jgi:hypothetical protein